MFRSIGPLEIGLIVFAIMIVFGVGKLPQVGGAIGKGIREFRSSVRGDKDDKDDVKAGEDKTAKL